MQYNQARLTAMAKTKVKLDISCLKRLTVKHLNEKS